MQSQKEKNPKLPAWERQTITALYTEGIPLGRFDEIEAAIVVSGNGQHRVFGRSMPCAEGEVYLVSPGVSHGFFAANEGEPLTVCTLRFRAKEWLAADIADEDGMRYCYGVFRDGAPVAYAKVTKQTVAELLALSEEIIRETEERRAEWCAVVGAKLSLFLIVVARYVDSSIRNLPAIPCREQSIVTTVIHITEERFGESDLSLDAIATLLYLSPSRLGRLFRRYMGQPYSEYIRRYRIEQACRLLAETAEPVHGIVAACGLRDVPSFYRTFRQYKGVTPQQYRNAIQNKKHNEKKETETMSILNEISENLQAGKAKAVKALVEQALNEGLDAKTILEEGLISGMNVIGEKFKNNEIYIPEVLVSARALNMGTQVLKPHFGEVGIKPIGRVCIGTVQGDLHDIGKNLVRMMMEGKQLEVIDLGTDVSAETFVRTAIEQECDVICCSALLTTTMGVMKDVVDAAVAAGIRDKVKIMIGGAPVNDEFCQKIGADVYTLDAASAADAAVKFCLAK